MLAGNVFAESLVSLSHGSQFVMPTSKTLRAEPIIYL